MHQPRAMENNTCCSKLNTGSLLKSFIAVFVVLWITDFVIHGKLLEPLYMATANLWRPEADMKALMPYMLVGQLIIAFFFTLIFTHGYNGTGWMEGVRYGALMTCMMAGHNLIMYSVTPWPMNLVLYWIALGFVQCTLMGVVAAVTYKK